MSIACTLPASKWSYLRAFYIRFILNHILYAARSIAEDLTCPQNETRIKSFRCEKDCYHVGPILTWHSSKKHTPLFYLELMQCDSPPPSCPLYRAFPWLIWTLRRLSYNHGIIVPKQWECKLKGSIGVNYCESKTYCNGMQGAKELKVFYILCPEIVSWFSPQSWIYPYVQDWIQPKLSLSVSSILPFRLCFDNNESAVLKVNRPIRAPFKNPKVLILFLYFLPQSKQPTKRLRRTRRAHWKPQTASQKKKGGTTR